jgi:hypothetical protein
MTTPNVPVATSPTPSTSTQASTLRERAAASGWWLLGAYILAGAAQLITISALVSVDPLAATWWSLLLAIAPAPLAAAATFAPAPANRLAVAGDLVVMIAGIAGGILHTGLFFLPALVILAVGAVKLWREQPARAAEAAAVS